MGGVYGRSAWEECMRRVLRTVFTVFQSCCSSPYSHASPHRIHTHLLKPATDKYGGNVVDRLLELVSGLLIDCE
jgi:hypothetical protein